MQVVDRDVGYFFRTDYPRTIESPDSSNTYFFVDLGVDSLLFRDDGINEDRRKRLLALGDSFVWGWGVDLEDAFTEVLEGLDTDLDVINGGMPGYTPRQYTDLLNKFVNSKLLLHGVTYNFYGGNDVIYEYAYREWKSINKQLGNPSIPYFIPVNIISQKAKDFEIAKMMARQAENEGWKGFVRFFLKQWLSSFRLSLRLGRFLAGKLDAMTALNPWRSANSSNPSQGSAYLFPACPVVRIADGSSLTLYNEFINSAAGEALSQDKRDFKALLQLSFPLAMESIAEAKEICDSLGLRFWLVYVPAKEEVYAEELCQGLDEPLRSEVLAKMNTMHNDVLRACRELGIEVIDLYEDCLRAKKAGLNLYYGVDPHFNKAGHKLWAEIVLKNIRETWGDDKG